MSDEYFLTNQLYYEEVGLKGEKEYYVKGYISTDEIDRANEVVTRDAMNDMLIQIKNGNIKLDVEHSTFTGENDIPVGRIIDAGIDGKGLWVKCTLNKAHSKFDEIWKSVKDGFIDAFSIAYKVKDAVKEVVNGVQVTLLKGVELLNVALTGNPVCRGARMTESFYKSLKHYKENGEVTNMPDENVKVEEVIVVEEQPKEEVIVEEQPKEEVVVEQPKEEPKEVITETVINPLDQIKSLESQLVELKSDNKKLLDEVKKLNSFIKEPQHKSIANTEIVIERKAMNPLDLL